MKLSRLVALLLVLPTVLGGLMLWSLGDRAEKTDRVPAAVVDLDKPVSMSQGGHQQTVYGGRLLAAGLTSPKHPREDDLGWSLTSAHTAEQGLQDGRYYAVITIPEDFSATLSKISGADPSQAGVTLLTNDASSAVVGQATRQVAETSTRELGQTITQHYLQGVAQQSGVLKGKLGDAADGADKLAGGNTKLQGGATKLAGGADQLRGGLDQASGGADRLAAGNDKLASGADRVAAGNRKLARGAAKLHHGTHQLASGLQQLDSRTGRLRGGGAQAAGLTQLAQGVDGYTQLVKGWSQACANPQQAQATPQLCQSTQQAAGTTGQVSSGMQQLSGAQGFATALPRLVAAIHQASLGARRLDRATGRMASGSDQLADGSNRLAQGARRLAGGAHQLADGTARASDGAGKLADGSRRLADGSGKLAAGDQKLAGGLHQGSDAITVPAKHQPTVVADPVDLSSHSINPSSEGRTNLLPAVLAFALWLGAFATYLVRRAFPEGRLRMVDGPLRLTLLGWLPAVGIGLAQTALLIVASSAMGVHMHSPWGLAGTAALVAAVFAAINQAFVGLLGQLRGWIASIAFATLQFVSVGGLVPIDTAPKTFQALNSVLPTSRATDAFAHLVLGGEVGAFPGDLIVLVLWGVAALVVSTIAARRAQMVDPAELRRGRRTELSPA